MEPAALKRIAIVAVAAVALVVAAVLWRDRGLEAPAKITVLVPDDVRIKVEVLNASGERGLARRATFALRDAGFDVVRFDNALESRDSTLVLSRSGHDDWADLVSRALGGAKVESRPDSARFVDVTVLLGADWRPPAKPFHP
jgi:hypothetical protein